MAFIVSICSIFVVLVISLLLPRISMKTVGINHSSQKVNSVKRTTAA